ncbi:MAG: DUF2461 domain-containing protein [Lentimicrobiaceae bacterium]|jgi:uncharacterized protein (TIGR02453 family)|nr:DUF2461 domain-containing protein [Lentimicrobiaceae bacterium]MCP4911440.1 DUF2461 domain-containing protein [Bacteroidota bacterium]MBT3454612.1 DUF2461 domain-containing protein [Lentimicrobiaceae bacterium]MBT3818310.1 DUF2461 domain-containing protein [Lentimicrobiaceae bacterium]MBT4062209.1 DUF2461 domain-containing protein [Lentimicrobiaceae bacterium]
MSVKIIAFLKQLNENNNREWFQNNKSKYIDAKEEFAEIINKVIQSLALYDIKLSRLQAKDSIFRIYRDIRFSKDKSPYKTHMGAYIAPGGRKSNYAGYYIHIEPNNTILAGGSYRPPANILKDIRSEIYYNANEYKAIINDKDFLKLFEEVRGNKLIRPPVGFSKDFKDLDLLKFKDYNIVHKVSDDFFEDDDYINNSMVVFSKMKPFNDFLNRTID